MSVSTHIVGFMSADDEQWKKNKAAWIACLNAGIKIPDELEKYFEGDDPRSMPGKEIKLTTPAVVNYDDDCKSGFEIHVESIPEKVKVIRIYNSY